MTNEAASTVNNARGGRLAKSALALALATPILAISASPASAANNGSDCGYTRTDGEKPAATVYTDDGRSGGMTGSAALAAGACVDSADSPLGGAVEVGTGEDPATAADDPDGPDAYLVADGDNENPDGLDSYAGVSNYESGTRDGSCDETSSGTGSNSGGCLQAGNVRQPVPFVVCGENSGKNTWAATPDDGCDVHALVPGDGGSSPGTPASGSDCNYATSQQVNSSAATGSSLVVYADAGGNAGSSGQADAAAGACANTGTPAADIEGGTAEAGTGTAPGGQGSYVVVDGDNDNADPSGQSDGYFGVSNFETGNKTSPAECTATGPDDANFPAPSSNSGGCVGWDGVGWVSLPSEVPTPICGNIAGNTWHSTARDGCTDIEGSW